MKNKMLKRCLSFFLSMSMLVPLGGSIGSSLAYAAGSLKVYGLTCEYNQNPEVVDRETPLLAWKLSSTDRGVVQAKYRITASTSLEKLVSGNYDAWDSGEVQSDKTTAIKYLGKKDSGADYYWKVHVWDNKGNTAQSEPAKFGMGLLTSEDWDSASWISNTRSVNTQAEYTVSMKFNLKSNADGRPTAASIIFGAQDASNYYMWQITSADGATIKDYLMLKPHERKNGNWKTYPVIKIPTDIIPDAKKYDNWYTLKIEYNNGKTTTYIDNHKIDERTLESAFGNGRLGFRACNQSSTNEVALYDDITVQENGKTIYEENFSNSSLDSFDTILGTGAALVQSGYVKLEATSSEFIMLQKQNTNAFTLESDFKIENQSIGFVFSHSDNSNFKMWQINIEKMESSQKICLRPHVWINGGASAEDIDISSFIPWSEKNSKHHLKIVVRDNYIATYIDGKLVHSDTKYESKPLGNVGFRMTRTTGDNPIYEKAEIDNYEIFDQMGTELYFNDFSGTQSPFSDGTIVDGKLKLVGSAEGIMLKIDDSKYTFQYDFQLAQSATGVIFGGVDDQNFYMWQVKEGIGANANKMWLRPHIWKGGSPTNLADIDITATIPWDKRLDPHHMKIEVDNGTITTFIDDKQVDTRSELPFSQLGLLGIRASKGEDGRVEKAYYDNFVLTGSNSKNIFSEDFSNSSAFKFTDGQVVSGRLFVDKEVLFWQESEKTSLPYLRKEFAAQNKTITRAKVFSSALGVYEMYINGNRVGEDYLAPGWTDYDKRVAYQGYDVTNLLQSGKSNIFGVRLAPGWYNGRIGITSGASHYGNDVAFIAKMLIEYSDGTSEVVVTDSTWKYTTDTPLKSSDILDGEAYDARLQIGDSPTAWSTTAVDDESWSNTYIKPTTRNLIANVDPPVQVTDELAAKKIWKLGNGNFVVDFGQNFAGLVKMTVKGKVGDKVTIRHAEVLGTDGKSIDTVNLRTAKATDTYIIGSVNAETFMPSFTFHGFRFIEISGLTDLKLADVTGMAIGSNLERTNTFESSSPLVNQLYSNIVWGQKGNYLSIPTDCPQRDERRGWTGDAQVFVRTGSYNMDSMSFYTKFMTDMRDAQREDGAYPNVAPNEGFTEAGVPAWGIAGVVGVWTMYHQYGDTRIIEDNFKAMDAWIKYNVGASKNLLYSDTSYGDWLNINEETDKGLVATAFFAYSTQLVAEMAQVMADLTNDAAYKQAAEYHAKLFNDIKNAYAKKFITSDAKCGNDTQASYVLSLAFDLVPSGLEQKAADRLADNIIRKHNGHLTTGFVSVGRLAPMLTKYGYNDIAYKLLTNKTYPSWGYSIERGATTIWERWNSCKDDGTIDETLASMNSLNHYSLGSIGEWMFTDSLGIDWDEQTPGFKKFVLKPSPTLNSSINMTYAKGTYESVNGTIKSDWSYDSSNMLVYKASVPANTKATLYLPAKEGNIIFESGKSAETAQGVKYIGKQKDTVVYELSSGDYEFTQKSTVIPVTGVLLDKTKMTINNVKKTVQLKATIAPSNATNKNVTWSSSNKSVAT
ncbi:MAG: alfa-L-rhamnosidase, partial [Oscillospiraceae bacterium]|nr:alfa-L-rhamnosidase [Oscillospiraceae bacterium]